MNIGTKSEVLGEVVGTDIVSSAIFVSGKAYHAYAALSQSGREAVVAAVRNALGPFVPEIAEMELQETGMGDLHDKSEKILLALNRTPGTEDLSMQVSADEDGITIHEHCAYGVVCAVPPATNHSATVISNVIGLLSAGNCVIVISHPRCRGVSGYTVRLIDDAIKSACGISGLVTEFSQESVELSLKLMNHPDVAMVVATGGGKMIRQALGCTKRVIGAGSANPVAMVDETADLSYAAKCIADGASFDNNITCVGEKNIVVVSEVAERLIEELVAQGAFYVSDCADMLKLTKATINNSFMMRRSMAGKSAMEILKEAEIPCDREVRLIVVETAKTHPFVTLEMLMPMVPIIRASNFDDLLEMALFIEQGNRHTAMIHSQNIARLSRAAQVMQTSVFIRNGSSLSALGFDGGAGTGFTIANITGEGVTTARDFARWRRCSYFA